MSEVAVPSAVLQNVLDGAADIIRSLLEHHDTFEISRHNLKAQNQGALRSLTTYQVVFVQENLMRMLQQLIPVYHTLTEHRVARWGEWSNNRLGPLVRKAIEYVAQPSDFTQGRVAVVSLLEVYPVGQELAGMTLVEYRRLIAEP